MAEVVDLQPAEADPRIKQLVTEIRDRFGVRGLRSARLLIDHEIGEAERALAELAKPAESAESAETVEQA